MTAELAAALSQTREHLLAIKLDGSKNPEAADQRIAACVQIVGMLREVPAGTNYTQTPPSLTPATSPPIAQPETQAAPGSIPSERNLLCPNCGTPVAGSFCDGCRSPIAAPYPMPSAGSPSSPHPSGVPAGIPTGASPSWTAPSASATPAQPSVADWNTPSQPWPPGIGYPAPQAWPGGQSDFTRSRRPPRRVVITIAIVILCILGITGGFMIISKGSRPGWTDSSLRVVGSPVAADGVVLALDLTSNRQLQLTAIRPTNGATLWTRTFSASQITPGVAFGPTVLGDTVLELAPVGGSDDPSVTVEGLDAATGNVVWSVPQPLVLSDAPAVCGGDFCIAAFSSDTTTALPLLDPATGHVVAVPEGPMRNMSVSPPGLSNSGGLWETSDSKATFDQISPAGQVLWSKAVAKIFGGTQYDPNYGWDFLAQGSLDVGSVGAAPSGATYPLDQFKTVGISVSDGTITWNDPGYFMCGGGLQFLTADVICRYSGTASETGNSVSMPGVGLTLEGVNPTSGTIKWSLPVQGAQALSLGTGVAFADSTHLVVTQLSGERALLDVTTGTLTALTSNEVFWCEQNPMYSVSTAQGASARGQRQGSPVFNTCAANGQSVQGVPSTQPSTAGVVSDGMFVWPTSNGLRAESHRS